MQDLEYSHMHTHAYYCGTNLLTYGLLLAGSAPAEPRDTPVEFTLKLSHSKYMWECHQRQQRKQEKQWQSQPDVKKVLDAEAQQVCALRVRFEVGCEGVSVH
jgi:hypothetical protein